MQSEGINTGNVLFFVITFKQGLSKFINKIIWFSRSVLAVECIAENRDCGDKVEQTSLNSIEHFLKYSDPLNLKNDNLI